MSTAQNAHGPLTGTGPLSVEGCARRSRPSHSRHSPGTASRTTRGSAGARRRATPPDIEDPSVLGTCGVPGPGGDTGVLFAELICAAYGPTSGLCPPGSTYPQPSTVALKPIPRDLAGMRDAWHAVPENPWCRRDHGWW